MKIHKPSIIPEFYHEPKPRVLFVLRAVNGDLVNCNDAAGAVAGLEEECQKYVQLMAEFKDE